MSQPFGSFPFDAAGVDNYSHPLFISAKRAPASQDIYPAGTGWIDNSVTPKVLYYSAGGGTWQENTLELSTDATFAGASNSTASSSLAIKTYVDGVAVAGAPISDVSTNGIGQIATDAEAIAGTANNPGVTALFVTPSNLPPVFAAPPAIGGTTPAGGAFTTLSASGAFSLTGDDVQVSEGGTGASDAPTARTNLGLEIGVDVQAWDAGLDDIAALAVTDGNIIVGNGTNWVAESGATARTSLGFDNIIQVATVTVSTAELLALATTPKELVAAPGAGNFIEFMGAKFILNYNSIPYTEAGDNLCIKYTDASGVQVSNTIEMTGFIDQTADTVTNAIPASDVIVAATACNNQALVLDNLGSNFGAGNSEMFVQVTYRVVASGL